MTEPITRDDLAGMRPRQIEEARRAGRLDHLIGGDPDEVDPQPQSGIDEPSTVPKVPLGPRTEPAPSQLTREHLKTMSASEINDARKSGRLDTLLGKTR